MTREETTQRYVIIVEKFIGIVFCFETNLFYLQDNLLFHDRDQNLINIPQKQLKLQLPRINQISDLVVVKKIGEVAEGKRVYEKFAEAVKKTDDINAAKRKFEDVVESVKNTGDTAEMRKILSGFIDSELNETITCM